MFVSFLKTKTSLKLFLYYKRDFVRQAFSEILILYQLLIISSQYPAAE